MWEYPRQSPRGDQMDITEVMEIDDGRITSHRVYWGWKGVGMLLRCERQPPCAAASSCAATASVTGP